MKSICLIAYFSRSHALRGNAAVDALRPLS